MSKLMKFTASGLIISAASLVLFGCKNIPTPIDPIQNIITNKVPDVVVPPVLPPVIVPDPAPNTPETNLPFDRGVCKFRRIAADILDWKETRTLTISKFSRDKLWSSCSGSDWGPTAEISGVTCQGCFILAVEQPDGSIIIGTFDFNRAKHQTMKGLENLHGSEHSFFNLRSGCRIWWATAGLCRDTRRNVKERTNFVPGVWP